MAKMKCGIEIHQRLVGTKLFCSCTPTDNEDYDHVFLRRLHTVMSELKEEDAAAKREADKQMIFLYQYNHKNACLVELDEEPPHDVSEQALKTTIAICKALHTDFVDRLIIMRKAVIDGSNTSGFQRTAVVGMNGYVDVGEKRVGIQTVCLEEESAGIVKREGDRATYELNRLGIPLVEIATAPDITTPEELRAVAETIGKILRFVGGVRRGLGVIRQDVNISIEGGARVEIKGVQDLDLLKTIAEYEIQRQQSLLIIIKKLKERFNGDLRFEYKTHEVTSELKNNLTKNNFIAKALNQGHVALLLVLPHHKGLLGYELCPGKRYGTELSDYAKTMGVGGIVHCDEQPEKYGFKDWSFLSQYLTQEDDCFVLVVGPKERCEKALSVVYERALMDYVPNETRKANPDGTSSYMRPLPGSARMYPETDVQMKDLSDLIANVEVRDPAKVEEMLKSSLGEDLYVKIRKSPYLSLFLELFDSTSDPKILAYILTDLCNTLKHEGRDVSQLFNKDILLPIVEAVAKKRLSKKALPKVFKALCDKPLAEVLDHYALISGAELENICAECNYDIKEVMKRYGSRVDGKEVVAICRSHSG